MTSLESIEKLRESLNACTTKAGVEPNRFDTYWITARACDILIDGIEREIAEKYMELPTGADGLPLRIGDCVMNTRTKSTMVIDEYRPYASGGWMEPKMYVHAKPDKLKELLDDLSNGVVGYPRNRVAGYLEDNHSLGEAVMLDIRDRLREMAKEGEL